MKNLFIILILLLGISGIVYAEDSTGLLSGNINLQGDTLYLPMKGEIAIGMGTTIATIKDGLIEMRGEVASVVGNNAHALTGIGIGINAQKLVETLGGQWMLKGINASIFGSALVDFSDKAKIVPAIGITILRVNF